MDFDNPDIYAMFKLLKMVDMDAYWDELEQAYFVDQDIINKITHFITENED